MNYATDPGSVPGSRRSSGEGIGYPFWYYWASLVAQLVKNPPAMRETWIRSLGWEDPLEKGKATHSNIQAWRIPWTVWSMGLQRVGHNWATCPLTFFHTVFVFARLIWLSMISSRSIRVAVNSKISFLLIAEQYSSVCVCVCVVCVYTHILHLYPFICQWILRLLP